MASAILAFLTALPDLAKLGTELMTWLKHVSGNDPQGFVKGLGEAMAQLNAAETDEERQRAAKAISDQLRGLG